MNSKEILTSLSAQSCVSLGFNDAAATFLILGPYVVYLSFGDYFILIVALGFMSPVSCCNPRRTEPLTDKCYFFSDTAWLRTIAVGIQKIHTRYTNIIFITLKLESDVQLRPKENSDQSFVTKLQGPPVNRAIW